MIKNYGLIELPQLDLTDHQQVALRKLLKVKDQKEFLLLLRVLRKSKQDYCLYKDTLGDLKNSEKRAELLRLKKALDKAKKYLGRLSSQDELFLDQMFYLENDKDVSLLDKQDLDHGSGFLYYLNGMIDASSKMAAEIPNQRYKTDNNLISTVYEMSQGFDLIYSERYRISSNSESKFFKFVKFFINEVIQHKINDPEELIEKVIAQRLEFPTSNNFYHLKGVTDF